MVLMLMVPIWVYVVTTQQHTSQEFSLSYAKNAAKQISDAASLVHSQGSPAKINIKVYIPHGINNVTIVGRTLVFNVTTGDQTQDIWYMSNADMQGGENIPIDEGYYYFDIISHDTYVEINRTV